MSARQIFDDIGQAGWAGVLDWKNTSAEENLQLEFKRQDDFQVGIFKDADKGQLAKAMSGFANVEGGVLVFGVHAKDRGKNPDQVQSICPIKDVAKFQAVIERSVHTLTDPPIPGVRVIRIEDTQQPGNGVVAVYVPPSDGGPHRATNATSEENDRYFMRTASQTVRMPHAVLAAMFGRAPQPRLRLIGRFFSNIHPTDAGFIHAKLRPELSIRNTGRGCARNPAVQFITNSDLTRSDLYSVFQNLQPGWHPSALQERKDQPTTVTIRSDPSVVIYPGDETLVVCSGGANSISKLFGPETSIRVTGNLFAIDVQPIFFDERIDASSLMKQVIWPSEPAHGED